MTRPSMGSVLDAARQHAGLSVAALRLACCGIGWTGTEGDLADVLSGDRVPAAGEYDEIAQALNERFIDLGYHHHHHPVPYAEEL